MEPEVKEKLKRVPGKSKGFHSVEVVVTEDQRNGRIRGLCRHTAAVDMNERCAGFIKQLKNQRSRIKLVEVNCLAELVSSGHDASIG